MRESCQAYCITIGAFTATGRLERSRPGRDSGSYIMKIGIVSDTHGLLRPEVIKALQGCGAILHAGDIDRQEILDTLSGIAPLYAVRGNADKDWAGDLPVLLDFSLEGLRICMAHKKKDLPADTSCYDLVVFGHSHKYESRLEGKTLFVNPGSCGPRRFHQPITLAVLGLEDGNKEAVRIDLPHKAARGGAPSVYTRTEIQKVMGEIEKGRSVAETAARLGYDQDFVEGVFRMYLTHPGVEAGQIMTKLGL